MSSAALPRVAYIGLGANLGDPPAQLREALQRLAALGQLRAVSRFYRSTAVGPGPQPDYCNAACRLDSSLAPSALMRELLAIEQAMGRVRGEKWGPRLIDLDLLHVAGEQCASAELELPHPGIARRNFVLRPLADIAPELSLPGIGRVVVAARTIGSAGLAVWQFPAATAQP